VVGKRSKAEVETKDVQQRTQKILEQVTWQVKCVAVCCSVLQCVAVCCSVLQCVTAVDQRRATTHSKDSGASNMAGEVCCSVLQCVAVCCSVLQCVAVCCSVLQCGTVVDNRRTTTHSTDSGSGIVAGEVCCSVLQCVLQCVVQCVLQSIAVCCSVLQCIAMNVKRFWIRYCGSPSVLQCVAVC